MASRQPPPRHVEELNRTTEHDLNATASDEEKRGVIGSVIKTVKDTYENARESIVGKRDPADNSHTTTQVVHVYDHNDGVSTGEVRDISANKSCGIYDSATQKSNEYADYAGEKAKEAKEKAGEYKDCAVEKAREGKDATVNKLGEYKDCTAEKAKEGKDSAVDAAKRAMGYLGDKKEETKEKTAETAEAAKQKTVEAKDKTKEMLSGGDEEARNKVEGENVKDEVFGGKTWRRGNEGVIKTEDTRTGAVAEKLKASDQMTGQTFNDVGPLDDEGVTRVGLLDIKK